MFEVRLEGKIRSQMKVIAELKPLKGISSEVLLHLFAAVLIGSLPLLLYLGKGG